MIDLAVDLSFLCAPSLSELAVELIALGAVLVGLGLGFLHRDHVTRIRIDRSFS
jgi:hypothetical protein